MVVGASTRSRPRLSSHSVRPLSKSMSMRVKRPAFSPTRCAISACAPSASGATTGPMAWPRPKRRSVAKPRALAVVVEHHGGVGVAATARRSAPARGMPRAAASSARSAGRSALVARAQAPAAAQRDRAARAGRRPGAGASRRCARSPSVRRGRGLRRSHAAARCSLPALPAAPSSGDGRCAGPGRRARRRPGRSSPAAAPQRQRSPVPTTSPSRSATRPSAWRKACSQSSGPVRPAQLHRSARGRPAGRPRSSPAVPRHRKSALRCSHRIVLLVGHRDYGGRNRHLVPDRMRLLCNSAACAVHGLADATSRCMRRRSTDTNAEPPRLAFPRHEVLAPCRLAERCVCHSGVRRIAMRRTHAEGARHGVPCGGRETAASFRRKPPFHDQCAAAPCCNDRIEKHPLQHHSETINMTFRAQVHHLRLLRHADPLPHGEWRARCSPTASRPSAWSSSSPTSAPTASTKCWATGSRTTRC